MRPLLADWISNLKLNLGIPAQNPVPSAALRDLEGRATSIDEHVGKGQWSLVVIWRSTCRVCASELPRFGAYFSSAPDPRFSIIGVALDGYARRGRVVDTMKQWNLDFPTLVAETPGLHWTPQESRAASVYGTPTFMLFEPSGRLKLLKIGPVFIASLEKFIRENSV